MKIAHFLAACSLVAAASVATVADARPHPRPHGRPGAHRPHCTTVWVNHHKVRRCR